MARFLLMWAAAAVPLTVVLVALAPDWAVAVGCAVLLALLAGGITTLNQSQPRK